MTRRAVAMALGLAACGTEGGGVEYSGAGDERVTWVQSGNVSNVSVLEGTFEFNVVVPNAISSFEAWGTKPNPTLGYGTNFQFSDATPYASPARVNPSSLSFAVHGAARVYGRQVLVGETPVGVPGVPRGKLQVLDSNGTNAWHDPAPFTAPASISYPLRSATTYGRDGFMAVGEHAQVFVTQGADSGFVTKGMNLDSWQAVDLHTVCDGTNHCLLDPGEYPNFYGVTRIGDANVIVGDDLTILVYRAQPPQWVARNGEVWEPWSRIRLAPRVAVGGDDPTPTLRAAAPDEVQEIVRPDERYPGVANVFPPTVDSEGWVLTVGDDGAAYRLRLHLSAAKVGLATSPFYDTAPDANDAHLPGPALQPLAFTGAGATLSAATYDTDADGYYDGNFYGVTSDEQSRVIVGSGNRVFTTPKYAPFDDRMLQDRKPTPPSGVAAADIVWRGVASDEVTWFLVGRGRLSTGASIGAYWYGRPEVTTCRAEYDPDCGLSFSLERCVDPTSGTGLLPSTNPADYRIGPARVAMNDAGELEEGAEADTVQVDGSPAVRVPPDPTPDPDAHIQIWKVNLEHVASHQQVEVLLMPSLTEWNQDCPTGALLSPPLPPPNPGFWAYMKSMGDIAFNRGFATFRLPNLPPAVLTDGHLPGVIQVDVFTGLGVVGAGVGQVSLNANLNPELSTPGGVCGAVRDQVDGGTGNTTEPGVPERALTDLIAGFSRFRSGDGHGFVDNYEAARQGKQQRYQSMKHYVYGRCRSNGCTPGTQDWIDACCDSAGPEALTGKREFIDLYAPFDALMFQLPNPEELNPLTWPAPGTPLLDHEGLWWTYPAGGAASGRDCSLFDGNSTVDDISQDQGRTVLLLNDSSSNKYRVAIVFDHAEACLTVTPDQPLAVQKGRRIARFMTHGETEVQLWVNDRVGRWRLMSYFDELPDDLYQYYVDNFDFSARGTYDDRAPAVSLAHRDQCPLLPEPSDGVMGKDMPDNPGLYRVCDTYGGYTMSAACPVEGCPSDTIMIPAATCATPSFVHARAPTPPPGAPLLPGNTWFERHPTDPAWFPLPLPAPPAP